MQYITVAKRYKIKKRIVHSHNSAATNKRKTIAHLIGKRIWGYSATAYWACSQKAAKWLFPRNIYLRGNYRIIHNAIETELYRFDVNRRNKIRKEFEWNNKLVIGEVGRFNLQKNHRFLIDIFSEIIKIQPNALLILVGDGELKEELYEYVHKKGLLEVVEFVGTSSRVPELMQGFDVFMLPSLYEGLPFVMVEAQAASLPIVASDTVTREVALTEYVKYESLRKTPREWAELVLEASKIQRKSDISKLKAAGFDAITMTNELEKLYQEMMG